MEETERALIQKLIHAEEDLDMWYPWHCSKSDCDHHMCRVRMRKIHRLDLTIRALEVHLKMIREYKRLRV